MDSYPFKPGDWVVNSAERVARVNKVWDMDDEVFLDLVMYNQEGDKMGRESPVCGGPRGYEPACPADDWERIEKPEFPITPKWVDNGKGGSQLRLHAGKRLPPLEWSPPKRRAKPAKINEDEALRNALKAIAEGHNDPRQLAKKVLGM